MKIKIEKPKFTNSVLLDGTMVTKSYKCDHCGHHASSDRMLKKHITQEHWQETFPDTPLKRLKETGLDWTGIAARLGVSTQLVIKVAKQPQAGTEKFWSKVSDFCQKVYRSDKKTEKNQIAAVYECEYCNTAFNDQRMLKKHKSINHWKESLPDSRLKDLRTVLSFKEIAELSDYAVAYIRNTVKQPHKGSKRFWGQIEEIAKVYLTQESKEEEVEIVQEGMEKQVKRVQVNFCPKCGFKVQEIEVANFCPSCGLDVGNIKVDS